MNNDDVFHETRHLHRCSHALSEHVNACPLCKHSEDKVVYVHAGCTMGLLLLNALARTRRALADAEDAARTGKCADCE